MKSGKVALVAARWFVLGMATGDNGDILRANGEASERGDWSDWGEWSACSMSDGQYGLHVRYRQCVSNETVTTTEAPETTVPETTTVEPILVTNVTCLLDALDTQVTPCEQSFRNCTELQEPGNGDISCTDANGHLSNCHFSCDSDYRIEGDNMTACFDGTWFGRVPTCELLDSITPDNNLCPHFRAPAHSTHLCYDAGAITQCLVTCIDGYRFSKEHSGFTQCSADRFVDEPPRCDRMMRQVKSCPKNSQPQACEWQPDCQFTCDTTTGHLREVCKTPGTDINCADEDCICDSGYAWTGDACIEYNLCGCQHLGKQYFWNDTRYNRDRCRETCTCTIHQGWVCEPGDGCPVGSHCIKTNRGRQCYREPAECDGIFTPWYNTHSPLTDRNDFEELQGLLDMGVPTVCSEPSSMQIRNAATQDPFYVNRKQIFDIDSLPGSFNCHRLDQRNRDYGGHRKWSCQDYEVRFCCGQHFDDSSCPLTTHAWTEWLNNHQPSNSIETETVADLSASGLLSSSCDSPKSIQVSQAADPSIPRENYTLSVDPAVGVSCRYNGAASNGQCPDLTIRLCCPKELSCLTWQAPLGYRWGLDPLWVKPNSCCGNRPYHTAMKRCCPGWRMVEIDESC